MYSNSTSIGQTASAYQSDQSAQSATNSQFFLSTPGGAAAGRGADEQGAARVGAHDIGGGLRGAGGGKRGRLGFFASPEGVNTEQDS